MKKVTLILCILGLLSLAVGGIMVSASSNTGSVTITNTGKIANPAESQPQQSRYEPTSHPAQLTQIGYLAISASIGFLAVAFVYNNRKPSA